MKNKLKNILFVLIFALFVPMTMFFSACGATASGTVTGIKFMPSDYEEDGTALFWVDKGVTTSLDYSVYPSSASGYKVYFDPIGTGTSENSLRYNFKDGKITVKYDEFEEVKYKVRVGNYTDTCIIRLKEYPKEIYTEQTEFVLNSGNVQDIVIKGNFKNIQNVETRGVILEQDDYSFLVESEDETIVNIPNKNRLKFIAVRQNGTASTNVKVTMLDCSGKKIENLTIKIKVTVVQNISTCKIVMSGVDEFVQNNDDVEVSFNRLKDSDVASYKLLTMKIYPINTNGQLYSQEEYEITLSKDRDYVILSDDGKSLLVKNTVLGESDGYSLTIKIFFPNLKVKSSDGNMTSFTISINLTIVD